MLTRPLLFLMAFAAGSSVANLYYNQPLLEQIRASFGVDPTVIGWIPTLTQAGYAIGMLFLVPLGDMIERKHLILAFGGLSAVFLSVFASAPSASTAILASFFIGVSTMTPQLLIPFAAGLAPPEKRGKIVGTMVSGLLIGILLARTISGFLGSAYGWRAMFSGAAAFIVLQTVVLAAVLPRSTPSFKGRYADLLRSVFTLVREHPTLREACHFGGCLFGAFSAFWANLIHLLETPTFGLGARSVGLFGLLGAAAAVASPLVGALGDRQDARSLTGWMIALTIVSFVVFGFSAGSLVGIGVGVLLMDIGVQAGHVCNQSRIFALVPSAQSRVQTAYMFSYFTGGALGSLAGTWGWTHFGWWGVCAAAIGLLAIAAAKLTRRPGPSIR